MVFISMWLDTATIHCSLSFQIVKNILSRPILLSLLQLSDTIRMLLCAPKRPELVVFQERRLNREKIFNTSAT
eukprot:snap_masked-scaffold_15-processed-gene-5.13-mRNA-1 protein AED:1.00 eAED:1.00 QI:0/0/0/0/1/1/4/0/72